MVLFSTFVLTSPRVADASGVHAWLQVTFTSPDYALTTLQEDIAAANSSLEIYIYQINNECNNMLDVR